jgi:SAM-dependent methyltransferase
MKYNWINPKEILQLKVKRVVLFGAGKGTEEFFQFLSKEDLKFDVCAIAENDSSLWGKELYGFLVITPDEISKFRPECIVITSISGRETISSQLEELGFSGKEYKAVSRYPHSYKSNLDYISKLLPGFPLSLRGKKCLNIGSGGFLGLESLLYAKGAAQVSAIDKFSFGIHFPGLSAKWDEYLQVRKFLKDNVPDGNQQRIVLSRFDELIIEEQESTFFDQEKIQYYHPVDVEEMPFEDNYFDYVFSFAVLEHVLHAKKAVSELLRVTKPGGINLHRIVTRDHRSFSNYFDFHPFSFRCYSENEWLEISVKKFFQNRLLPVEWEKLFSLCGGNNISYKIFEQLAVTVEKKRTFAKKFQLFSLEELGAVDCIIVNEKW